MLIIEIINPAKEVISPTQGVNVFGAIKDIILIGTALTGAIVASRGVTTWKRQINGQTNHNLCKNFLVSIFKYRDAISIVRNPIMFPSEQPLPPHEQLETMDEAEKRHYGLTKAYEARWETVREANSQVYAYLIETEALWGDDVKKMWLNIRRLESELLYSLEEILKEYNPRIPNNYKMDSETTIEHRKIIYEKSKDDEFKTSLENEMLRIENYVRGKFKG